MNPPAEDLRRFLFACLFGLGLGLLWDFLRPFRQKRPNLSDGLFLLVTGQVWLYLGFSVCKGDLRLGYSLGLLLGGFVWEITLGQLFRPVFLGFSRIITEIFSFFALPMKKFFKKIAKNAKFLLATGKKAVTIKCKHQNQHKKKGGVIDDLIIYQLGKDNFFVEIMDHGIQEGSFKVAKEAEKNLKKLQKRS